jgi:hypothetical protein
MNAPESARPTVLCQVVDQALQEWNQMPHNVPGLSQAQFIANRVSEWMNGYDWQPTPGGS